MTQKNDLSGCGILVALALVVGFSWYAPWWSLLISIGLLIAAAKASNKSIASGICGIGLLTLVLSFSFVCMRISSCNTRQQDEREIQLANEQVAEGVRIAQDSFDKGELDNAESKLNEIRAITKATDVGAANALQERINAVRQAKMAAEAAETATKANRQVAEHLEWAKFAFNGGNLKTAEDRLAKAFAVQGATDTTKAQELLAKVQAARQAELFRTVQNAVDQQKYGDAVKSIDNYLATYPNADNQSVVKVTNLLQAIGHDDKARSLLQSMSDAQLASFSATGKVPAELTVKEVTCADAVEAAVVKHIGAEKSRREQIRVARIEEANRQKAIQDAQRIAKLEEERRKKERAESEVRKRNESSRKIEAWVMAKQFIKDRLKSPSTADFGSLFGEDQDPEECVGVIGHNRFKVKGWVDAQNAFGATVRTHFLLHLEDAGNGTWRLTEEPIMIQR